MVTETWVQPTIEQEPSADSMLFKKNPLKSLYYWVLGWADSPYGPLALFLLAIAESSFFPVPPDVLLIALCIGGPYRWLRFATICSLGSVIGGCLGYLIGFAFYDVLGQWIIDFTATLSHQDTQALYNKVAEYFAQYGAWVVGIAGFTPIPYKVFTITAGFSKMAFLPFLIASAISRSARFFIVAAIIGLLFEKYGERIKLFVDKYFNLLSLAFVILLILGFVVIKYLF